MDIKESDKTRIGNSLICSFAQIAQIKWAICSDRSGQMSNCEQIAQVAHWKMRRSLMINEWMSKLLVFSEQIAHSLFHSFAHKKRAIRSKNLNKIEEQFAHSLFFYWAMWANRSGCSPKISDVSQSLRSLTKISDVSESLRSLTKNERIARFFEQIAHKLIFCKKQQFT